MTTQRITITHDMKQIMSFQSVNNVMPTSLSQYCPEYGGDLVLRDMLLREVDSVVKSILNGKNPNDIIFKNILIEHLNKVSSKTYESCIESLHKLNYNNKEHFETLAFELIMRAMTDTVVVKGIDLPDGQQTQSDIYADIAAEFSSFMIKLENKDIKFITILLDLCEKYFKDFTNVTKPLDQNNQYRVDHFKGFMNFLGLLFNRGIISHQIILSCLNELKKLMFLDIWGSVETENIFDGYIRLISQILAISEKKNMKRTTVDIEYIKKVKLLHNDIKKKNLEYNNKLRKFAMMSHTNIDNRLTKLAEYVESKNK